MTDLQTARRGRWAVAAMFLANGFTMGAWAPQIPLLLPRHDISEFTLGLLILALGLGAVGTVWALMRLDIPWRDLFSGAQTALLPRLDTLAIDTAFLKLAAGQITDTLWMAWVATLLSALVAFVLAPLGAARLSVGSYLVDPPRPRGAGRWLRPVGALVSRVVLQFTRVMPELTLALLFVADHDICD